MGQALFQQNIRLRPLEADYGGSFSINKLKINKKNRLFLSDCNLTKIYILLNYIYNEAPEKNARRQRPL